MVRQGAKDERRTLLSGVSQVRLLAVVATSVIREDYLRWRERALNQQELRALRRVTR